MRTLFANTSESSVTTLGKIEATLGCACPRDPAVGISHGASYPIVELAICLMAQLRFQGVTSIVIEQTLPHDLQDVYTPVQVMEPSVEPRLRSSLDLELSEGA
jgi:hypothetical protein